MRCLLSPLSLHSRTLIPNQLTKRPVELRAFGLYGYNYTWEHYGSLDLAARVPLSRYFELDAAAELSTVNVYSFSFNARPLFPVPVGELFLDTRLLYKVVARNRMHDFVGSFSFGYRMDYVNVSVGLFSRIMADFDRDWHSEDEFLVEPFGVLYNLEVFVRPQVSPWNLSFRISNFDDYNQERVWQMLFMLGGSYSPTEHLTLLAQVQCKPTGMFHLNATFYGIQGRLGVAYRF